MTIAQLTAVLTLQAENFQNGIKDSARQAKEFEKSIKPSLDLAKDLGAAMTVAGGAVTGALGIMVKQAADYGDALRDASIRTGVTVQSMAGLKMAAEQSGASFEELQMGLKKLAVNADAATVSGSAQAKMFESMGVTVKDVHTGAMRPMSDILLDVAEHFKTQGDKTLEAGEAVKLFGKNGVSMIEFLELGKAGLQEFQDKAEKLGLVIGNDVADQADSFKDTLNDLHAAELGLSLVIGNELLPKLTSMAVWFTNTLVSVREFVNEHRGLIDVMAVVGTVIGTVGAALITMTTILPAARAAWIALDVAMDANPIGLVVVALGAVVTALVYFRNELAGYALAAFGKWFDGVEMFLGGVQSIAEAVGLDGLSGKIGQARDYINGLSSEMALASKVVLDGARAADTNAVSVAKVRDVHKELNPILEDTSKATEAAWKAWEKYNGVIDGFVESTFKAAVQAPQLDEAINRLETTGTSTSVILKYLGDAIEKTAENMTELGLPIPKRIADLNTLKQSMDFAAAASKDLGDNIKTLSEFKNVLPVADVVAAAPPLEQFNALATKTIGTMESMQKQTDDVETAIAQMTAAGYDNNTIMQYLAPSINWAAESAIKFRTNIGPLTEGMYYFTKQSAEAAAESKHWSDEWAKNFESVTSGAVNAFDQIIFHGKSFGQAFSDLGKNLAESFFKTFTSELLSPVTSAMEDLGRSAAKALSGVLNGNGSPGGGGLLSSVIGAIPGLGGNGNSIPGQTASGLANAGFSEAGSTGLSLTQSGAGAGAGQAASLGSSIATGAATAGIGLAASYGLQIAMDWYKNLPHFKQDELVHNIQMPFDQSFGNIIGAVTEGLNDGSITVDDAQLADDHMYTMWAATSAAVNNWAAGDSNKTKALTGFHATEDAFVRGWLDWIDSVTIGLGGHKGSIYSFGVGTPYVTHDQLALIHKGEMITPASENPYNPAGGGRGMGGDVHVSIDARGSNMSEQQWRNIAEYTAECIKNNTRGVGHTIARAMKVQMNSVVTA